MYDLILAKDSRIEVANRGELASVMIILTGFFPISGSQEDISAFADEGMTVFKYFTAES